LLGDANRIHPIPLLQIYIILLKNDLKPSKTHSRTGNLVSKF